MNITIEEANNAAAMRAACYVREQVFGKQCYRRLPRLDGYDPTQVLTLIARPADSNEPIATLSVVETTDDTTLHTALELSVPDGARVARYTQLAVLTPYRGLHVPARMVFEARRRFVLPKQFAYTWLLLDANTARSSLFCTDLGFKASARVFATEYGRSRVLVKEENTHAAARFGYHATEPAPLPWPNRSVDRANMPHLRAFSHVIFKDEWPQ